MNEIEKAIEQLKHDKENFEDLLKENRPSMIKERVENIIKAHRLGMEALEKQIPKKPIQNSWSIAKCPCCGIELGEWLEDDYIKDYTNLKICDCGQKLDWGDNQ